MSLPIRKRLGVCKKSPGRGYLEEPREAHASTDTPAPYWEWPGCYSVMKFPWGKFHPWALASVHVRIASKLGLRESVSLCPVKVDHSSSGVGTAQWGSNAVMLNPLSNIMFIWVGLKRVTVRILIGTINCKFLVGGGAAQAHHRLPMFQSVLTSQAREELWSVQRQLELIGNSPFLGLVVRSCPSTDEVPTDPGAACLVSLLWWHHSDVGA